MKRGKAALGIVCILAAGIASVHQFSSDNLVPLLISVLLLLPLWWLRRPWFRWGLLIPIFAFGLLLTDAFFLRHRITVEMRAWNLIWDTSIVEDILISPSGSATVYIIGDHWIDSGYSAYISDGSLFPHYAPIEPDLLPDPAYPRDVSLGWSGTLFIVGEDSISLVYDEENCRLVRHWDWPISNAKSTESVRESFTKHVRELQRQRERKLSKD